MCLRRLKIKIIFIRGAQGLTDWLTDCSAAGIPSQLLKEQVLRTWAGWLTYRGSKEQPIIILEAANNYSRSRRKQPLLPIGISSIMSILLKILCSLPAAQQEGSSKYHTIITKRWVQNSVVYDKSIFHGSYINYCRMLGAAFPYGMKKKLTICWEPLITVCSTYCIGEEPLASRRGYLRPRLLILGWI
jgi:hypothetical protein